MGAWLLGMNHQENYLVDVKYWLDIFLKREEEEEGWSCSLSQTKQGL